MGHNATFAPAGGIQELSFDQIEDVNGGNPLVIVAVVVVAVIVVGFGLGVVSGYNSYQGGDSHRQSNVKLN